MQLIVAEKPSVGRDLARVLGVRGSGRNSLQGDGRVITWCIGHLVELEEPAAYDPRWKAWRMDVLPMIPTAFKLRPVASSRDQLRAVRELLRERRFSEVVNACDAGREGELIFRYVYELAQCRLPVRRLWISSLTDEAIRQGFAGLRPGAAFDALADAARCRSEADWLVGMNATRAVTIRFRASAVGGSSGNPKSPPSDPITRGREPFTRGRRAGKGHFTRGRATTGWRAELPAVYSIGRVQTPTLAIVVRRELEIRDFEPRDYWEVRGTFAIAAKTAGAAATADRHPGTGRGDSTVDANTQSFTALWNWRRPSGDKAPLTRFASRAHADEVVARARAATGASAAARPIVERLTQKRSREPAPQLFDLTSLQRTANRRYGMSASRTLETAQALYERHKVLTYPRTDSRHLPHDMVAELPKLFRGMTRVPLYAPFAESLVDVDLGPVARSRRIFDDSKVHDHHAIIPTGKIPTAGALGPDEQRIFDLVVRRFLGVFYPDAEFALTEVIVRVGVEGKAATEQLKGPTPSRENGRGNVEPGATGAKDDNSDETLLELLPPPPDRFVARGRIRLVPGWQTVAGFDDAPAGARSTTERGDTERGHGGGRSTNQTVETTAGANLPTLVEGQTLQGGFEALSRQTRPPPRHSEATLLTAMESAGREIDDEALRAAMKDTGLGTPATRAATIETLLKRGFIARDGKQLSATTTGIALITGLPVPSLASPELTGAWEARLVRVARGQDTRAAFMSDIVRYVREVTDALRGGPPPTAIIDRAVPQPPATQVPKRAVPKRAVPKRAPQDSSAVPSPPPPPLPSLPCPRCQKGTLLTGHRGWGCSEWRTGCLFVIWFDLEGKRITDTQLRDLIQKGKTRKSKWSRGEGPAIAGRAVLDLTASRAEGAARFSPE